ASVLTGRLRYDVSSGAVTSLLVDVPPELEVRSARAGRPPRMPGPAPRTPAELSAGELPVRLSDWTVGPAPKRGPEAAALLRLEFPGPVTGAVEVTLELVPRAAWRGSVR